MAGFYEGWTYCGRKFGDFQLQEVGWPLASLRTEKDPKVEVFQTP